MAFGIAYFAVACFICYGIFQILMWHMRRRRLYELASKFEGPSPLPFIGNAHMFVGSGEYLLDKISQMIALYPSPCRAWLGPHLIVSLGDPEQIKAMFLSPTTLNKGDQFVEFCRPMMGEGLLIAPAARWKVHRKLIQPTFNANILNSFVKIFAAQSKILTERMESNLDGPETEVFSLVSLCTLDMICETALGVNVGAQMNRNHEYVQAVEKWASSICKRLFSIWLHPNFFFNLSQLGRDQQKCIKFWHNFTDNVIQTKKGEVLKRDCQPGETGSEDDTMELMPRREVFLDCLMKLSCGSGSAGLSDEELREEVDSMVMAGSETTANTNSYVMLMLASRPDVQDKVYRELHEIYGDVDIEERPVTAEDLPRMKYLERVIKETLRLFPVVPIILRAVTDEFDIGDYVVPSGCSIAIGIHRLHRNEKYWPDPLEFDPDRFLPEEVAKRHPYSYIPFSGGPRNCVGKSSATIANMYSCNSWRSNYAMMSMKTLVATILRRYILKKDNIVPVKDIRLQMEFVLKPVDPIRVGIHRRTRNF